MINGQKFCCENTLDGYNHFHPSFVNAEYRKYEDLERKIQKIWRFGDSFQIQKFKIVLTISVKYCYNKALKIQTKLNCYNLFKNVNPEDFFLLANNSET